MMKTKPTKKHRNSNPQVQLQQRHIIIRRLKQLQPEEMQPEGKKEAKNKKIRMTAD